MQIKGFNTEEERFERLVRGAFSTSDQSPVLGFYTPGSCQAGQFDCGDQKTCVSDTAKADCTIDCPNGMDEGVYNWRTNHKSPDLFSFAKKTKSKIS